MLEQLLVLLLIALVSLTVIIVIAYRRVSNEWTKLERDCSEIKKNNMKKSVTEILTLFILKKSRS